MAWPPTGPSSVLNAIPAYVYVQHNDDDNIQSFVQAYNAYAQAYINWFNNLNLPVYINGNIAGPLLDWVLTNLYGFRRPGLPNSGSAGKGEFNTYQYNAMEFNGFKPAVTTAYTATTDDTYKRCMTWLFFKGDGRVFSIPWLKRRIMRFLYGFNGTNGYIDNTYPVSVTYTGFKAATITLATTTESTIFKAAVEAGVLELPVQTEWTVTLT